MPAPQSLFYSLEFQSGHPSLSCPLDFGTATWLFKKGLKVLFKIISLKVCFPCALFLLGDAFENPMAEKWDKNEYHK